MREANIRLERGAPMGASNDWDAMLRTSELDYDLPEELIATQPIEPRDSARLLVVRLSKPDEIEHRVFRELDELLEPGDLMVVNSTKVMPARFSGVRDDTGGRAEGLYIGPAPVPTRAPAPGLTPEASKTGESNHDGVPHWHVLLKLRRMKPDVTMSLFDRQGSLSGVRLRLIERCPDDAGWIVRVELSERHQAAASEQTSRQQTLDVLSRVGLMPVPPYIIAARKRSEIFVSDENDQREYQTVYAHNADESPARGSIAAPTAGLHFTHELLDRLARRGVERQEVMLDVGMGTFKPVEADFVEQHAMHEEFCSVPIACSDAIRRLRSERPKSRLIAVGTTSARTLESFPSIAKLAELGHAGMSSRLLITPGFRWQHCDGLITNFHLPKTTLLAMVASRLLAPGETDPAVGIRRLMNIYKEAIARRYRLFSYGDAMLILP